MTDTASTDNGGTEIVVNEAPPASPVDEGDTTVITEVVPNDSSPTDVALQFGQYREEAEARFSRLEFELAAARNDAATATATAEVAGEIAADAGSAVAEAQEQANAEGVDVDGDGTPDIPAVEIPEVDSAPNREHPFARKINFPRRKRGK